MQTETKNKTFFDNIERELSTLSGIDEVLYDMTFAGKMKNIMVDAKNRILKCGSGCELHFDINKAFNKKVEINQTHFLKIEIGGNLFKIGIDRIFVHPNTGNKLVYVNEIKKVNAE